LKQAREERDVILKEAKQLKDKIVAEAKEVAQAEGGKIIEQAKREIEDQKLKALAEVKNQVSTLSLDIARKVLTKEFEDQGKQEALVADLMKDVKLN
jgi:F-type H+-transporting ATPase subunit b